VFGLEFKVLRELKKLGKRIHIYGASTKGNTILQWCGIDNRIIDMTAERDSGKYAALPLRTEIPSVSDAGSRAMKLDCYLALPWYLKGEFLKREKTMLDAGVGLISAFPVIDVVKRWNISRK
jgi:hypothetical protein